MKKMAVPVWPYVGQLLGLSRSTTYDLARQQKLPVKVWRVGKKLLVAVRDLEEVLGEISDGGEDLMDTNWSKSSREIPGKEIA